MARTIFGGNHSGHPHGDANSGSRGGGCDRLGIRGGCLGSRGFSARAFGQQPDSLEQVHGPLELRIGVGQYQITQAGLLGHGVQTQGVIDAIGATGHTPELDGRFVFVGDGDDDVGRDTPLVDHLVARGVILGGGEAQGGTIVEG